MNKWMNDERISIYTSESFSVDLKLTYFQHPRKQRTRLSEGEMTDSSWWCISIISFRLFLHFWECDKRRMNARKGQRWCEQRFQSSVQISDVTLTFKAAFYLFHSQTLKFTLAVLFFVRFGLRATAVTGTSCFHATGMNSVWLCSKGITSYHMLRSQTVQRGLVWLYSVLL